ncbi:ATP-binding protein [Salinimonas sp. HHU 13199]|uniref:ATP-binding protein n=1 Tax=Salinimonas profundi TaxID=2729140 RepID=A0ABR8LQ86_9ALTE|nr:AAA family ATPase [Salinimonas profundi]MBD3587081.1 ATP-binding protein [Salinimonas profundi]
MLYIVTGQPAVGKTTWATRQAANLRACLIDIDDVFEPVIKAGLTLSGMNADDRESAAYKQAFREPVYEAMFAAARANLTHVPVVLCAPFTRELTNPEWTQQLKHRFECDIIVYWLHAPAAQLKKQMERRGNPRDREKLENWEHYQKYFSAEKPRCEYIPIDMGEKKNGS